MKKYLLMGVMALALAVPGAAMAETAPPPAPPPGGPQKPAMAPENFEARKAKVLERLGKRIAALQKSQSCAQAATDAKALRACKPERAKAGKRRGKGMRKGMNMGPPPLPPGEPAAQ